MSTSDELLRCSYVLPKKNRRCRMLVKKDNLFCGEHAMHDKNNQDRIPCPNDGKHTVARSELTQHLKRCNSRLSSEPWIVEDLNAIGGETKFDAKIDRRPTQEELESVVSKIEACYNQIYPEIEDEQMTTPRIEDYLAGSSDLGEVNRKHLHQQSSIIGYMLQSTLLADSDSSCIFELGAGKAQLAYWMAKVAPRSRFLLVDRSGARNKYDNKALQEDPNLNMKRLRCSIEHLDLSNVELLKDASHLGAVCKHFCGSATDAGVRCLMNGVSRGLPLDGFVLVPCCHHKSRFVEYCGHSFLSQWQMDNEVDFSALRHVASWATCGITLTKTTLSGNGEPDSLEQQTETADKNTTSNGGTSHITGGSPAKKLCLGPDPKPEGVSSQVESEQHPWSADWKECLGRKAKAVLEIGRARHLASLGFNTRVIRYVPHSISPENLLILGISNKTA